MMRSRSALLTRKRAQYASSVRATVIAWAIRPWGASSWSRRRSRVGDEGRAASASARRSALCLDEVSCAAHEAEREAGTEERGPAGGRAGRVVGGGVGLQESRRYGQ